MAEEQRVKIGVDEDGNDVFVLLSNSRDSTIGCVMQIFGAIVTLALLGIAYYALTHGGF